MDTNTNTKSLANNPEKTREVPARLAHIKSWGADLDYANRPAYPMERMPARLEGDHSHAPVQQAQTVEILQSIERPGITLIFGTPQPSSGLSGMLRRAAFGYSESDLRHWLILLFADRVNMVEGLASDLRSGHVPNLFAEMGGKAEFKYNLPAAIQKVVVVTAVVGLGLLLWSQSKGREDGPPPTPFGLALAQPPVSAAPARVIGTCRSRRFPGGNGRGVPRCSRDRARRRKIGRRRCVHRPAFAPEARAARAALLKHLPARISAP